MEDNVVSPDEVLQELINSGIVSNAVVQLAANSVAAKRSNQQLQKSNQELMEQLGVVSNKAEPKGEGEDE